MADIRFLLAAVFLLLNVFAFLVVLADKFRARQGRSERVSEGMLIFLATAFGALGVYAGMFTIRHKTRKWYFLVGIPLLFLQNLATFVLLAFFLSEGFVGRSGF